jgi:glyoxylase-like metal-dependent hydrolase (beta-lactamase superfamily II)
MLLHAVEGNTLKLDGGAMFGNAPKVLWEKWLKPDDNNRILLASRAMLVQTTQGLNILFEAGTGAFFDPKLKERYGIEDPEHALLRNLKALGLTENDIDAVVLSHLHFDHAGGLLSTYDEGKPRLIFPKAQYYVGKEHWKRACHPHMRDQVSFIPILHSLLEESHRLHFVSVNDLKIGDLAIRFHYSHGHTPGLMLAEIQANGKPLAFASDLVPGVPWLHLPITLGYDRFPELKVNEKKKLLDSLASSQGMLFLTHDISTPCISLSLDNQGKCLAEPIKLPLTF